ncbi:enoyl-CoA hydratase/isomerase family protein [Xanthomonas vesicatoria]|uniref:enoyl-CoA hydratase/isomerase family protein n=1 Tax=Xanthomonas vesicatoria TaxID=56460 RepID=UPI00156011C3|nr:enoyl-CoA hydratase/isomerase family protein [Xanthomonas vesicatoria]MCC8559372.1 enoyl-CoA hydratase/isomerase family protein [Xanthomonas vesicatoria]MCC8602348.1 enoyl-CoA hydratase/isomerase family protein [Xanthomonas vesicatoria]MCC8610891.1 enoyl-CoA hydratase/isomerase family protein [Xanthomonas vesicatoria]MCC8675597.1 enoyl-CoA hydratase/isomerase family protein [Xanthomonas vesicatoria]MCC8676023.1 enoyl-CoA hydratase/isomerase family protein [Xanthomonas vesicatoria]
MEQPLMTERSPTDAAPVLFEQRDCADGHRIGVATLNAPKMLNGLSLQMTRLLDAQLQEWAGDAQIACVVLRGAGDKALCAGGDLHGLYQSMRAHRDAVPDAAQRRARPQDNPYAAAFFEEEYRLDYRIHTYAKPLLCWGHGIVMGGGIGLMSGASHRVVTERSRLAMPEISVGLFPDVGGSWLLRRVPHGAGLFLALTGAPLNASDAIYAGLADVRLEHAQYSAVLDALSAHAWTGDAGNDREQLGAFLQGIAQPLEPGPLQLHAALIAQLVSGDTLEQVVDAIAALQSEDGWLQAARATLAAGAPGSARLAWELQRHPGTATLAETFRTEYVAALHAAAHGDFAEGILALLIDKDRQPQWQPASLSAADTQWAAGFFNAPWPAAQHPLADLGAHQT